MYDNYGLNENFTFLVVRVHQQMEDTRMALQSGQKILPNRMKVREDYIDNLKIIIERKSYKKILQSRSGDDRVIRVVSSLNTAASNLEEIGDYLINIASQIRYFQDPVFMGRFDYNGYFNIIENALNLIATSLFKGAIKDALAICRAEIELDEKFEEDFKTIMAILRTGSDIGDAITALNVLRYLERIGDSLLNIGEAIISSNAGTRLKLFEYLALQDQLSSADGGFILENIPAETQSGCRIEKVISRDAPDISQEIIFKEGDLGKIEMEKKKLERWQEIMPGLTPRIFGYQNLNDKAFLLLEYIGGLNFQEIIIRRKDDMLERAFARLRSTVTEIWSGTRQEGARPAFFIRQLIEKLPDIYGVHIAFNKPFKAVGSLEKQSFINRLEQAALIENSLAPPFSVFIHGDFNTDNIIYNFNEDRIYYIDTYRSHDLDYVQDVSVFMVSNFRLPFFDPDLRARITRFINDFYLFAGGFAERNGDQTFNARLALGLVRSLITSTRFILQEKFALALYMRGNYLLDKVLEHEGRPWEEFRLPEDVFMFY